MPKSSSSQQPQTHPPHAQHPSVSPVAGSVVVALAAGGVLVSLAQTLIIPLINDLPSMFNTSAANASWIITATLLAGAVSTPITGRLADMYGKKRMLLASLFVFTLGSALAASTTGLTMMIAGRALQGVASGLIPLGISLMHDLLSRERAGRAIALMSASMGIGGSLGLPLAAAVAQYASWRWLFAAVALISIVLMGALHRAIPRDIPSGHSARFDIVGATGLSIGLIALLLAISKGTDWGWVSPTTVMCGTGAIIALGLWAAHQSQRQNPLVNLRTAGTPRVLLTNIASVLIGFTMYAMNLLVPPLMQLPVNLGYGLGQSMVGMGLWVIPMGLGMFMVTNLGPALSSRRSPRFTLIVSGLLTAAGYSIVLLTMLTIGNRSPGVAPEGRILGTLIILSLASAVVGAGVALALGATPALILSSVPASETASANGLNALARSLGTSTAAAVLGVVLASFTRPEQTNAPSLAGYLIGIGLTVLVALLATAVAMAIPKVEPTMGQQGQDQTSSPRSTASAPPSQ